MSDGKAPGKPVLSAPATQPRETLRIVTWYDYSVATHYNAVLLSIRNVLADAYTMGKPHFRYCAEEFLCWSHRSPNLLKILKKSKAGGIFHECSFCFTKFYGALLVDVICLQEVQNFEYFWEPEMAMLGYEGSFTPRTKAQGHVWDDGIATFVLSSKYAVDHVTPVHYNDLANGNMTSPHLVCLYLMNPHVSRCDTLLSGRVDDR